MDKEILNQSNGTITITPSVSLHLIDPPQPGTPFEVVGSFGFTESSNTGYQTRYFVMTYKGELREKVRGGEDNIIIKVGDKVEKHFSSIDCKVSDIKLPKSLGFSGNKRIYNSNK